MMSHDFFIFFKKGLGPLLLKGHFLEVFNVSFRIDLYNSGTDASGAGSISLPTTPTGDCIVFHGVTYLGCATVNAPRSEVEIYRNMAVLNEQSQGDIPIVLSVPATADGTVRLVILFATTFFNNHNIAAIILPIGISFMVFILTFIFLLMNITFCNILAVKG